MKYILVYTLLCMSIFFTGCIQITQQKQRTTISGEQLFSSVPIESGQEQFLESELYSGVYLDGIHTPMLISGYTLVVSGIFSVDIPKETVNKIYFSQYTPVNKSYYEWIGFNNKDKRKSFTIYISKLIRPQTTYTDKNLCLVEYYDGFISKSEKTKIIQNQKIYVYYATLMSSGPDITPQKIIDTQFCFVDNGMVYKFSASNYSHTYMNQIIDSFKFID